jgi:hypothetical protein
MEREHERLRSLLSLRVGSARWRQGRKTTQCAKFTARADWL